MAICMYLVALIKKRLYFGQREEMNKVTDAIKTLCLPRFSISCDCAASCVRLFLRTYVQFFLKYQIQRGHFDPFQPFVRYVPHGCQNMLKLPALLSGGNKQDSGGQ